MIMDYFGRFLFNIHISPSSIIHVVDNIVILLGQNTRDAFAINHTFVLTLK